MTMTITKILRREDRRIEPELSIATNCDLCKKDFKPGTLVPVGGNAMVCDPCFDRIAREEQ